MAYIVLTDNKKFLKLTKIISELSTISFEVMKNNIIESLYHMNSVYDIPRQYSNYQNIDDKNMLESFVCTEMKNLRNHGVSAKEITDMLDSLPYRTQKNESLSIEIDNKEFRLNLKAIDDNSKNEIDKFLNNTIKKTFKEKTK